MIYKASKSMINWFLGKTISRMFEIAESLSRTLPMKLHGEELYTMAYLFFALIGTLYPLTGAVLSISGAIFVTSSLSVISALYNLVDFAKNGGDPSIIVSSLQVIIIFMYNVLKNQILKQPWWKQATGFASLSADTAKNAIASVIVVLAYAAALAALVYYMTLFIYDVNDSDDTYW